MSAHVISVRSHGNFLKTMTVGEDVSINSIYYIILSTFLFLPCSGPSPMSARVCK